ncbi:MAG: hypothetical protein AAFQ42_01330 [Pseudomonadota bacterium]
MATAFDEASAEELALANGLSAPGAANGWADIADRTAVDAPSETTSVTGAAEAMNTARASMHPEQDPIQNPLQSPSVSPEPAQVAPTAGLPGLTVADAAGVSATDRFTFAAAGSFDGLDAIGDAGSSLPGAVPVTEHVTPLADGGARQPGSPTNEDAGASASPTVLSSDTLVFAEAEAFARQTSEPDIAEIIALQSGDGFISSSGASVAAAFADGEGETMAEGDSSSGADTIAESFAGDGIPGRATFAATDEWIPPADALTDLTTVTDLATPNADTTEG